MSDGYTDAMLIDAQEQEITRLRAENEQMRGLLYEWQGRPEEECLEDIDERTTAALGAEHE